MSAEKERSILSFLLLLLVARFNSHLGRMLLLVLFALLLLELGSGFSPHAINPIMTRLEAQTRHTSKFVDFIIARSEGRNSKPFA